MDFARKQLEKYGWKEGQGLGKNEDGISQPIRPKLKFDNTGIGHDAGEEFTNKWWESLFNNASQNIDIKVRNENVSLVLKSEPIEITTRNYSLKRNDENALQKSFLKTSKLSSKGIENYDVPIIHENPKKYSALTDEELLAACGGRTAHKGARHGLKLSGKLSRIEKQEKLLLKKMKMISLDDESRIIRKMKKLQLQRKKTVRDNTNDNVEPVSDSSCSSTKKKKKSKKNVSFNDTVVEYSIPSIDNNANMKANPVAREGDAVNADEGIEQDIEDNNNNPESGDHRSFEEPQSVVSDLSKAERKKLRKKRKLEGKNTATMKFIQSVQDEAMEESSSNHNCECKKRKLNNSEVKCSESKRNQLEIEAAEKLKTKRSKKTKKDNKAKKEKRRQKRAEDQKIRNIVMSLNNVCKISDDI